MAFSTRITLERISKKDKNSFKGEFSLDIGNLDIHNRAFTFSAELPSNLRVYKDGKLFAKEFKKTNPKKQRQDKRLVLIALKVILEAYFDRLNPDKFALTKVERGMKVSVSTSTPDNLALPLISACI